MTVTALPSRNEYTGSSGQTVFNYTFKIYAASDLNVYITPNGQDADDSSDITTNYTVDPTTIQDEDGGFITLNVGVNTGDLVTIVSNIAEDRTTDYQNSGDFLPDTVNADFDRTVSLVKQQDDRSLRTLAFEESQQNAEGLTLPAPAGGQYLKWRQDETGVENAGVGDPASDASLVSYTAPYSGAVQRTVSARLGDWVSVKDFGAIGDGAQDESDAFQAALDADVYCVYVPAGTYLLDNATAVDVNGKCLLGEGIGKSILKMTETTPNLKVRGDYGSLQKVSIIDYGFVSIQTGDNISIVGNEIDNTNAVDYATNRNGFKVSSSAEINGFTFSGNYIHNCAIALFTASDFGSDIGGIFGYCYDSLIINNHVARTRKAGFSFNADADAYVIPNNPWKKMIVAGNTFTDYYGDDTTNRPIAIGCDYASNLLIDNNMIDGYGRAGSVGTDTGYNAAIHIEDGSRNVTISNNVILDCEKGIEVYDSANNVAVVGNSLTGKEGNIYADNPASFPIPDEGYTTSTGIAYISSDPAISSKGISVTGNTVSNFRKGLLLADSTFGGPCTGNTIRLCSAGIQYGGDSSSFLADANTMNNCRYVYAVETNDNSSGHAGVNSAVNCDDMVYFLSSGNYFMVMRGIKWTYEQAAIPDAATTAFDLFEMPSVMNCVINSLISNDQTDAKSTNQVSASFDGTTVTDSKDFEAVQGSTNIKFGSGPSVQDNAGRLEVRLFSSVGASSTGYIDLEFNGYMAYGE